MEKSPAMRYVGNGSAIFGIPARDLTQAEVDIHGESVLLHSGLYVKVPPVQNKMGRGPTENKSLTDVVEKE